ncbi:unnamed protein product, partial [Mesocestoides corti]|uniref:Ig-like domain-containing protein n=1 Tax=Mesocestoides corti TaxID=53468 RepID=A0A0R3UIR2_MESCO
FAFCFFFCVARSEGAIIVGEHDITVHVRSGENLIQSCKVNAEHHRSVTIRWGKIIDPGKTVSAYEGAGKEVIQLSNIAFIVFPLMPTSEASNKLTSSAPIISAPFAVSDPGSSESQLVIQRVTERDAGVYICSVITESGWDDRKLMRVVVSGANGCLFPFTFTPSDGQTEQSAESLEENSYQRRLALYIAAPVVVFFVCIFIISYCVISRKGRRCSQSESAGHARATLPAMRQMGNSNNSVGVYRRTLNGNSFSGKTNNMGLVDHHRAHHSPQGPPSTVTVTAANQVAYSSSTGSHSLSGTSAGTPGSMLLANTMVQVLPPDGSGYPLLKPNGHHHQSPSPHQTTYDPYNGGHPSSGGGGGGGMVYMPSGYHDFQG